MFKPQRHEFTCPDVIYLRDRQKKNAIANIAVTLGLMGGFWVAGWVSEKRAIAQYKNENPVEE